MPPRPTRCAIVSALILAPSPFVRRSRDFAARAAFVVAEGPNHATHFSCESALIQICRLARARPQPTSAAFRPDFRWHRCCSLLLRNVTHPLVAAQSVGDRARSPIQPNPMTFRRKETYITHQTHTTRTPPVPPPTLACPACQNVTLCYAKSFLSGARHREQWDQYVCGRCRNVYEYRQRTGHLRHIAESATS